METITKRLSQLDLSEVKEKKNVMLFGSRRYIISIVSLNLHFWSKDQHLRILSRSILRLPRRLVHGDGTQKW